MHDGYSVIPVKDSGYICVLPEEFMNRFGIYENETINLHFGTATTSARVQHIPAGIFPNKLLGLSRDTLDTLKIPERTTLLVKKVGSKELRLGPVIGVLTFNRIINRNKLGYYKRPALINKSNGILFVFAKQGINVDNRTVEGYYYDHFRETWIAREFPFPDAVINRCYPNNYETVKVLEDAIGAKVFNKSSLINKKDFYDTLKADPFLCHHLPETHELSNPSGAAQFLLQHKKAYAKPLDGMRGKGIIYCGLAQDGQLQCSYFQNNQMHFTTLPSVHDFFSIIEKISGGEKPYIVQQSVESMLYEGCSFSIRIWTMKNGNGIWVMPGMYATGSCKNSYLTNAAAGSKIIALKKLFKEIIPDLSYTKSQLVILLENLTLKTARILDEKYGPLGVLGIDIMIDKNGRVWLIEANGNPGRVSVLKQDEYFSWSTQVFQHPLAYATYLAGFSGRQPRKIYKSKGDLLNVMWRSHSDRLEKTAAEARAAEAETEKEKMEMQVVEEPNAGETVAEELVAEESVAEESNAEELVAEEPSAEEMAADKQIMEKKTIMASVVIAKGTLRETREMLITAPQGFSALRDPGRTEIASRLEAAGASVCTCQVTQNKLVIIGYIPLRINYDYGGASGTAPVNAQEVSVPVQFETEISGINPGDEAQAEISVESGFVSMLSESSDGASGTAGEVESEPKCSLRVDLKSDFVITRNSLIIVPSIVEENVK